MYLRPHTKFIRRPTLLQIGLSGLKETVAPAELDRSLDTRPITGSTDTYPFATVLRLRVLQVSQNVFLYFRALDPSS